MQFRHKEQSLVSFSIGWQPEPLDRFLIFAIDIEKLQGVIGAVTNNNTRFRTTGIYPQAMRRIELPFTFSRTAKN